MEPSGSSPFQIQRIPVQGSVPDALGQLPMPASVTEQWARFSEPLVRTVLVAQADAGLVGAAIVVARPLAGYVKIGAVWTNDELGIAAETEQALVADAEQLGWESGCIVVKRESPLGPAVRSALPPGYVRIEAPLIAAPIPDPATPVPSALFKWRSRSARRAVPYMRQTTDFTCGTAALSMVLAHLELIERPTRALELDLWRQATTVLACDPYGLAVAAAGHGLRPAVSVSTDDALFIEGLLSEQDRELRRFIQGNFRALADRAGIRPELRAFAVDDLRDVITAGGLAIVLVDELLVHGTACPHWILVHGMEGEFFIAHDPWTEPSQGETWVDGYEVPLSAAALEQIAWTGDPPYRAMLAFTR